MSPRKDSTIRPRPPRTGQRPGGRPGAFRGELLGALSACFLVAVLANASSLSNGFTYDDHVIVEENPLVTDRSRAALIWTMPYWGDRDEAGLFRPVTTLTYALNHELHGLEPFGFHLVLRTE